MPTPRPPIGEDRRDLQHRKASSLTHGRRSEENENRPPAIGQHPCSTWQPQDSRLRPPPLHFARLTGKVSEISSLLERSWGDTHHFRCAVPRAAINRQAKDLYQRPRIAAFLLSRCRHDQTVSDLPSEPPPSNNSFLLALCSC